ncbi:hypothetical protein G7046_g3363 [Stylonectria norvegica]|nr:hypothetical protein G7046_g3363 [Stylonectria norvegica]
MTWNRIWRKASSHAQAQAQGRALSPVELRLAQQQLRLHQKARYLHITSANSNAAQDVNSSTSSSSLLASGHDRGPSISNAAKARAKKQALDTLMSVLEVSATKRDAKGYLQKYVNESSDLQKGLSKPLVEPAQFVQGEQQPDTSTTELSPLHVAIMKLRVPQQVSSDTLRGVAKTVSQLRQLGLVSVVVVDCGVEESRLTFQDQAFRLCEAIDSFGEPGARLAKDLFSLSGRSSKSSPSFLSGDIKVDDHGYLGHMLRRGLIPVIPSLVTRDETCPPQPIDSNKMILALTRHFAGLQFDSPDDDIAPMDFALTRPKMVASVERIIILDPLGGVPMTGLPGACHRFINLEQEYGMLLKDLAGPDGSPMADEVDAKAFVTAHAANLTLAKDALAMLPSSSSTLITTPSAASGLSDADSRQFGLGEMVTTRRKKNPLLHNLLTDKPVYSSSLPIIRTGSESSSGDTLGFQSTTASTLLKRGMPLTIFPNPRETPWVPPKPGGPRLRLTDTCIDLPRLVHLIEDSFGRKLDVEDYLNRVNENLAGVIVAGEYEGGAILTWERPEGISERTAYEEGRFVPYLDKFAVLRRSQGSGGVADVVFNAMVQSCFPQGVSWRSRKDNPVNKWYFERSNGTSKLTGCNWTMFWTTNGLDFRHPKLQDYEAYYDHDYNGNQVDDGDDDDVVGDLDSGDKVSIELRPRDWHAGPELGPPKLQLSGGFGELEPPGTGAPPLESEPLVLPRDYPHDPPNPLSTLIPKPTSLKMDFTNIGKNLSTFGAQITPFASRTFQYTKEQLGQAEDKACRHETQLPPDYIDLEKRVDALKQAHQKMLAVTSQYSNEAYDYPPNIKETFQDLGRTVSEKVTLLSSATSPAEAQAALVAPPSAKPQPKTFNHAVARASLSSSQLLHQHHTGAGEDPLATALEKYALAMERVGEARLAQDAQIQSRFLAGWNTTLNTNLTFATRARKNVEKSRLSLDAVKAHVKGTTFKLGGHAAANAEHPEEQELSPEAQEEIEKAEDEFVTQTEEAVGVMKNVLDTPEPLRNLAELIAAQIEYHKKAYEVLSELAPVVEGLQTEQEASYRKNREDAS